MRRYTRYSNVYLIFLKGQIRRSIIFEGEMGEKRGVYFEEHNITQKHIVSRTVTALSTHRARDIASRISCERNEVRNYFWN